MRLAPETLPPPPEGPIGLARFIVSTRVLRSRPWLGQAIALAVFATALGLRLAVNDMLPPGFPYLTFFPAVILTTFFCGLWPGITCAVLSGLASRYLFIKPFESFTLDFPAAVALGFYAFIVVVDIALIHFMHVAGDRLQAEQKVTADLYAEQRTLFQELQHRVANNMQFVAALLALQKRKVGNDPKAAITALDEARARLETISRIHRRLYDPARLALPVRDYLQELCADLLDATGAQNIVCHVDAPQVGFELTRLTNLSLLIAEIVTNSIKHAFDPGQHGTIAIRLEALAPDKFALTIDDDGRGFPSDFDPAKSKSLGFRISQGLAGQLGGTLAYATENGATVRLVPS